VTDAVPSPIAPIPAAPAHIFSFFCIAMA
jgi:hypothetical protein